MKIWEKTAGYAILHAYSTTCVKMSFRSLKIKGLENMPDPRDAAVILAPNHCAALMDPLLILMLSKDHMPVGFGARSDIFKKPLTAKILNWLRILPIARERNGLHEVAKNLATFDAAIECMKHGAPFCMYAEGTHRAARGMLPVKKGIFRIAKMALDRVDKPVYVVPIGVEYEYFFREMGRVEIRIGEPIDVGAYYASHQNEVDADIYRELCAELQSRDLALLEEMPSPSRDPFFLKLLAAILSLPLYLVCVVGSIPIWLPSTLILRGFEDKAWTHTVYYACRFLFPICWGFDWLAGVLANFHYELFKKEKTPIEE